MKIAQHMSVEVGQVLVRSFKSQHCTVTSLRAMIFAERKNDQHYQCECKLDLRVRSQSPATSTFLFPVLASLDPSMSARSDESAPWLVEQFQSHLHKIFEIACHLGPLRDPQNRCQA